MKDWQFYPLIMLFAGAMIAYALSLADYEDIKGENGVVLEGRSLSTLYSSEGVSYSIAGDNVNPHAYAVLSAHVSRANAPPSAGVFLTLAPKDSQAFAGKPLRVTIRARKGRATPLETFDMAYFGQRGAGQSPWQSFELTRDFKDYSFEFTPKPVATQGNDYVGIWPDVQGRGRTLDVKWLKVEVITP